MDTPAAQIEWLSKLDHCTFSFCELSILPCEQQSITWMLKWTAERMGHSDLQAAAGHLALSLTPGFLQDELDILKALRCALRRLLKAAKLLYLPAVIGLQESTMDFFTHEECHAGNAFWPISDLGDSDALRLYSSADSWAYHCMVNGLVHPLTRRPIYKFGWVQSTSVATPTSWWLPKFLQMPERDRLTLWSAMDLPPKVSLYGPMTMKQFEWIYGIPSERSLLTLANDLRDGPTDRPLEHELI